MKRFKFKVGFKVPSNLYATGYRIEYEQIIVEGLSWELARKRLIAGYDNLANVSYIREVF